jgi:hypothetical protein
MSLAVLGALAAVVVKSGVWVMPNIRAQFHVSQSLTGAGNYLTTSYLQPAIFGVLGGRTLPAYIAYCSIVSLGFFVTFMVAHARRQDDPFRALGVVVFPVLSAPFYWLGVDGMTLLVMLATMLTMGSRWSWLFAALLSWQHFEQGIIAFTVLAITLAMTRQTRPLRHVAAILVALVLGKVALVIYFHAAGIVLANDRWDLMVTTLKETMTEWRSRWFLILWSLLGPGWLLVVARVRHTWPLLVAAGMVLVILVAVYDQTRVGVILLFPSLVYWITANRDLWTRSWVAVLLLSHLAFPFAYLWGGVLCGSVRHYTVRQLTRGDMTHLDAMEPIWGGACSAQMLDELVRRLAHKAGRM